MKQYAKKALPYVLTAAIAACANEREPRLRPLTVMLEDPASREIVTVIGELRPDGLYRLGSGTVYTGNRLTVTGQAIITARDEDADGTIDGLLISGADPSTPPSSVRLEDR